MDCTRLDLIGYHFATLDEEGRREVEAHLKACSSCLEAFLAVKRHADGTTMGSRPSEAARTRLRREVERTFAPAPWREWLAWLVRPIPLYQGLAAATLVLVFTMLVPALGHSWRLQRTSLHGYGREEGAAVDTARMTAESNTIY